MRPSDDDRVTIVAAGAPVHEALAGGSSGPRRDPRPGDHAYSVKPIDRATPRGSRAGDRRHDHRRGSLAEGASWMRCSRSLQIGRARPASSSSPSKGCPDPRPPPSCSPRLGSTRVASSIPPADVSPRRLSKRDAGSGKRAAPPGGSRFLKTGRRGDAPGPSTGGNLSSASDPTAATCEHAVPCCTADSVEPVPTLICGPDDGAGGGARRPGHAG